MAVFEEFHQEIVWRIYRQLNLAGKDVRSLTVLMSAVRSLPYGFLCKLIMIPVNISPLIMSVTRLATLGAL